MHESSKDFADHIQNNHDQSEEFLDKIKEIYEIAAETGLGGEFDKRRKTLSEDLTRWRKHVVRATEILFVAIALLFSSSCIW